MKTFHLSLFLLVMLCALPLQAAAAENASVSAALIRFKKVSVESDPNGFLRDWVANSSTPPCFWRGVICSGDNFVTGLDLSSMALTGRLRLDDLIDLHTIGEISFRNNQFYGNISFPVTTDCSFETVDLSANNFSGAVIGHFLNSCSYLISLNLSMNSITGGIFPYASSLRVLDVSLNKISDSGLLNYALSSCESMMLLNFSNNKLAGGLRAVAQSCVNLTTIDLSNNKFSSGIPADFIWRSSPSLKQLDLSHNNFSDDFSKLDFGDCAAITSLDLSSNRLAGGIPPSLANCRSLQMLSLSSNELAGGLPAFWPALTNLQRLFLADNRLSGEIPTELGQICGTLAELNLSGNQLTGGLPVSFTSCSSLRSLDLGNNQLSGHFIEQVISTMPELRLLRLAFNNITGSVPLPALANCSTLELIDLSANMFTGVIPDGLCRALPSLRSLILPDNLISGTVPADLGNCTNLEEIDFSFNFLSGSIPLPVWSLPKLTDLIMWANNLSGEIPESLCSNGANLETLILSHNVISGGIPSSITRCSKLIWVALSGNRLVGDIPTGMGSLQSLAILQLGNNSLSGVIPPDLGSCRSLIWLDLNSNHLTGPVPSTLASQTGLIAPGGVSGKRFAFLRNAAGNICPGAGELFEFQGIRQERLAEFPLVHSCPATRIYTGTTVYSYSSNGSMIYLDLSYNSLAGTIPENFGFMNYLQVLNLGHNELTGMIPQSFGGLKSILGLDLSNNHLTGSIPGVLGTLTFLDDLDVSDNNLSGLIPSSGQLTTFPASRYDNNSGLCGLPLPPCSSRAGDDGSSSSLSQQKRFSGGGSIVIGVALSVFIIFSLLLTLYKMKQQNLKEEQADGYVEELHNSGASSWKLSGVLEPLSINVATFEKPLKKLTFAHLLEATNGFSADSLIGTGGFGEVYKARLKDGTVVAIKKLIQATGQGDREFTAEMETIGKIKHRNLVPLLGYCKIGEERLLIYEYMKHGSLDMLLNNKSKGGICKLDWAARKKIAIGAARGLAFLHHSCIPHIIHRDMKSSNVLLDENMEARVSDFGMARLMNALDTHLSVSTLAGTPGYVPPEYYQSFRCTTKGDVYSYGVVLLELVTGKKPVDQSEFGDNNLVGWTKQMIQENRSTEIFDPVLMGKKSGEAELYRYLKIADLCLDDRPFRRPTMIQVMAMFKELQVDSDSDFLEGLSIERAIIEDSREKT